MIDANSKKNFLRGRSPAILYLWERSEECDLIETVCQQLDSKSSYDSSTGQIPSLLSSKQQKKQKKRKNNGETKDIERLEIMQMNANISTKQHTRQKAKQSIEDTHDKLYGVIKEMMDRKGRVFSKNVSKRLKRGPENSKRRLLCCKRKLMSVHNIKLVGRFQKLPLFLS